MTITKYDRVAILPKRCSRCNRLFWLEPYNVYYMEVGVGRVSFERVKCSECVKAEQKEKGKK